MDAKEVAKVYNKVLQNREYMNGLFNESHDENEVLRTLSGALEFIVASRKFAPNEYLENRYMVLRRLYDLGLNNDEIDENIFSNPILCHAFNGDNYEKVLKFGLGNYKILDKKYLKKIDKVESVFTDLDSFYQFQLNKRNEFFAGFPGFAEMEFVAKNSPERLFLGIFNQKIAQSEPIIIGETKKGYYTRVIDHKIDALKDCLDKDKIKNIAHDIVNKFCSKRPILALFDAFSKNGEYNLTTLDFIRSKSISLKDYIFHQRERIVNPIESFSRFSCSKNLTALDDIALYDSIVPSNALGFVEMPDSYEIKQYLAFIRGREWGDLIDFHSGEKVYIDNFIRKKEIEKSENEGNLISMKHYKNKTNVDIFEIFKNKKLVESEMENSKKRNELKMKLFISSKEELKLLQREENVAEMVAISKKIDKKYETKNKIETLNEVKTIGKIKEAEIVQDAEMTF